MARVRDSESAQILDQSGVCSFGSSGRAAAKNEDRFSAILGDDSPSAFAVYDGHNGAGAAEECAADGKAGLCARIIASADPTDPMVIEKACWDLDESIGVSGVHSGTTATLLVCAPSAEGMRCALAWVGDSDAVHFDISPNRLCKIEGKILHSTKSSPHQPRVGSEKANLETLGRIREQLEQSPGTSLEAAASAALGGRAPSVEELTLFNRAMRRAELIAATMPSDGDAARRAAIVGKRSTPSGESKTLVVATAERHDMPHYFDLAMTRSIGDWVGPDRVLPQPQVLSFDVPFGQHSRVILATDGLWGKVSQEDACERTRVCETPQGAADALLLDHDARLQERKEARGGAEGRIDDVRIVVVDLNPSQLPFTQPSASYLLGFGALGFPLPSIVCKLFSVALLLILINAGYFLGPLIAETLSAPKANATAAGGGMGGGGMGGGGMGGGKGMGGSGKGMGMPMRPTAGNAPTAASKAQHNMGSHGAMAHNKNATALGDGHGALQQQHQQNAAGLRRRARY